MIRWPDGLSWLFILLALVLGPLISLVVLNFGWATLIALPAMVIVVATVLNPNLGLAALIIVIFAQFQRVVTEFHGLPGPGEPLVAFLLGVVVIRFLIFNERPVSWMKNSFILVAYLVFLVIAVITAGQLNPALEELLDVVQNLVIASIVLYFIQNSGSLKSAIWAVIVAGVIMASISVFQRLTGTYGNEYWGFGGWEYSGYVGRPRLSGPYATPNPYAQVLVLIFILALDRLWHEKSLWLKSLAGYASVVCALALIFTDSRGGFANLVFTLIVFFLFNRPNLTVLLTVFLIGLMIFQFMPANYTDRILTLTELNPFQLNSQQLQDESFRGRASENLAAWRMFLDHPVFGVGLNNYSYYYQSYSREIGLDNRREARDPASLYLQLMADQGLVGIVVFISLLFFVFANLRRAYKGFKLIAKTDEMYMSMALFAALAGYMFMALYRNNAYTNVFWVLIAICMSTKQVLDNMLSNDQDWDQNLDQKTELIR